MEICGGSRTEGYRLIFETPKCSVSAPGLARQGNSYSTPPKERTSENKKRSLELQNTPKTKTNRRRELVTTVKKAENMFQFNGQENFHRGSQCFSFEPVIERRESEDEEFQESICQTPARGEKTSYSKSTLMVELSQPRRTEMSPFCRLLNQSDYESREKYQLLGNTDDQDREVLAKFVSNFNERNDGVINLFSKNTIFEIIGEAIYSLDVTLQVWLMMAIFKCEGDGEEF
eukprot:TRINITY_DN1409_c0_g2_i1.p1 TRINITY_DN1409_c0_g2~~TRINITY_DN1409_c0_g2_i1.p1  ORF type:complete len:231 (-),score=53.21 TRINITY_DN1409_c0_g2_i1:206-898(-)